MQLNKKCRVLLMLSLLCVQGCSPAMPKVGPGLATLVTEGVAVSGADFSNLKQGRSCNYNILSLVSYGDASIATAKKEGNISQVYSVDREILSMNAIPVNYLPLIFARVCTVVKGISE